MAFDKDGEQNLTKSGVAEALIWLGGGDARAVLETRERSADALAGIVVLVNVCLAWLAASGALAASPWMPLGAAIAIGLLFGLLVGVVSRAAANGAKPSGPGLAGRAIGALAMGAIAGELASMVLFSGAIQRRIDDQAALAVQSAPAVAQASAALGQARAARTALDTAVEQARTNRDEALVVARCEYNPSPDCPQTHITGVPGTGPEARTANLMLADAQRELDSAVTARTDGATRLDGAIGAADQELTAARTAATADPDRGLGARWVALNSLTIAGAGALVLRLVAAAFFGLLTLLPLILRMWRGETSHDRVLASRIKRDIADLDAQTAIAVKQAEIRTATESLWAEKQLADVRLAVEAQYEISREHHRRRVADAVGTFAGSTEAPGSIERGPVDLYLPIAAEAEAASRAGAQSKAELPAESGTGAKADLEPCAERPARSPLIPVLPDVDPLANVRAAARWISPLVPQIVARAIDTTRQPLRAAKQAFEEVEEITFSFKRVHKVTLNSEHGVGEQDEVEQRAKVAHTFSEDDRPRWVHSSSYRPAETGPRTAASSIGASSGRDAALPGPTSSRKRQLSSGAGPHSIPGSEGPRELPPAD